MTSAPHSGAEPSPRGRFLRAAAAIGVIVVSLAMAAGFATLWSSGRGFGGHTPPVPLLWKVADADNSLYLLGSFHLLKPDDYPLSADVDNAFADAEALMFEVSPSELGSPALSQAMRRAGTRGDGALNDDLPAETAARLRRWVAANGPALAAMQLDGEDLQRFEPWFAGLLISLTEMSKLGLNPELGLDRRLGERAARAGKPATGLERGLDQIALLDGMGRSEQRQLLQEALDASDGGAEIMTMHADWRRGDIDALWREMALAFRRDYPALYRRINVERNQTWLPKLEARLQRPGRDDTLVVVGALHLLGEDGVVEMLRAKGYRVERICSACPANARPAAE